MDVTKRTTLSARSLVIIALKAGFLIFNFVVRKKLKAMLNNYDNNNNIVNLMSE